ncbi:MAG: D-alanyl-D-alanine carboxypeptidase family protein [Patescibacteria group bacterium]
MKKLFFFVFSFLAILTASYLGYKFLISENNSITSPLPGFLTSFSNRQVSSLDIWKPVFQSNAESKMPDITARSALIYDLTSDKVLYDKNIRKKFPIASLTKIMTAVVALEHPKKNDKYFVTRSDLVGEDSMGLSEGEILSLNELLYGLILHSGNDAAETLASNFPGGRTAFIKAMNDKAKALGLENTNFTNPSGLEGDGDQYSTTEDLLVITRYALFNFPTFSKIAATAEYTIPKTSAHNEYYMENETNLLTTYPGVKGVKTGYTPEAGFCLITYLEYGDHKIVGILLGSENRRQEMKDLLDYSLKTLGIEPPEHD